MSTPRKLTLLTTIAAPLVVITLALLTAFGAVPVAGALGLAAAAAVLAAQALTLVTLRRTDGKALRVDNRVKRQETELAKVRAAVERLDGRLDEIVSLLREESGRHEEDLRAILVSLGEDRLAAVPRRREMEEMVSELLPKLAAAEARPWRAGPEGAA
ncbi:hypothetical protein ACFQ08_33970 [Streptosporangium algeriense]|uniref:Uncharacterized protein n=1 Tax=Streptosporangium algeriense TaxID=1682748 RepID=A0ABW3E0F6_9ACTN